MAYQLHTLIGSAADVVTARQKGRSLAMELGFAGSDLTVIATAISEVARNIVTHAKCGEVTLSPTHQGNRNGICVIASDQGPGIPDIHRAMEIGFSTQNGMGVGLPGARRLMDDFRVRSQVGKGTKVIMTKWLQ
jgi:serine/threonine-protein kinase RsbT